MKNTLKLAAAVIALCILLTACTFTINLGEPVSGTGTVTSSRAETITVTNGADFDFDSVPEFSGYPYVIINDNIPDFYEGEITTDSYEEYGALDYLGRCTACEACIGKDLMPTEKRGAIGMVKPTGWQTVKYDGIDGNYLYNRCHLIGYQLTAENANTRNLITGTRYLNTAGMLPFENIVADYVRNSKKHVMYRVTPLFKDDELVARGVQMEAYSVEDNGKSVCFNVYCYNNQPDIEIDYQTGKSKRGTSTTTTAVSGDYYIINKNSKKFHRSTCPLAKDISEKNKKKSASTRSELINQGYSPCKNCKP